MQAIAAIDQIYAYIYSVLKSLYLANEKSIHTCFSAQTVEVFFLSKISAWFQTKTICNLSDIHYIYIYVYIIYIQYVQSIHVARDFKCIQF